MPIPCPRGMMESVPSDCLKRCCVSTWLCLADADGQGVNSVPDIDGDNGAGVAVFVFVT